MYAENRSLTGMVRWSALAPALFLGLAVTSIPAQAGDLYAGVNYGNLKMKDKGACGTAGVVLNSGYSCTSSDNSDNVAKLFGGYQLMENLGFELGYVSFSETTASASGTAKGTATSVTAKTKFKSKGFVFGVVGTLPVTNEFGFIGRLGIHRWNVQSEATTSAGTSALAKDTKPGFAFDNIGVGAKYSFSKTMDVRMEWERYLDVGDDHITGQTNIDTVTLGLVFKF